MNYIKTSYEALAQRLNPIGRIAFVPYSILRVSQQLVYFFLLNLASYIGLIFVYNYNLLNILQKSKTDSLTFAELFQQKRSNNKYRVRDNSRPVALEMKTIFDVPTCSHDFINKVWLRTDYYYDRMIVHAPAWITAAILFEKPSYLYNPDGLRLDRDIFDATANNHTEPEIFNIIDKDGKLHSFELPFVPKPYIINESVKRKQTSAPDSIEDSFSKNVAAGCPNIPITSLFSEPIVTPEIRNISPAVEGEKNIAAVDKPIETLSSNKRFFHKIKIRKKSKSERHSERHPTYGNYELLAQAIKNILSQPYYSPGCTIGPDIIRIAWSCRDHYEEKTDTVSIGDVTLGFTQELKVTGNKGLNTAKLHLDQIHEEFSWLTFADLYTFAGCVAIEYMGGPKIEWQPGRTDSIDFLNPKPIGKLLLATKDSAHIKESFYGHLGFSAQEIVALIGGSYGVGGCHTRFNGLNVPRTESLYTWNNSFFKSLLTDEWKLDVFPQSKVKQYYNHDKSLMISKVDMKLLRYPEFKKWVKIFAEDNDFFNQQFAVAFAKLLEFSPSNDEDGVKKAKY